MHNEISLQLEQLESWQRGLEAGRGLIAEAGLVLSSAKQAQIQRRWEDSAKKFREAHSIYEAARQKLTVPAAIDATTYRALQVLRDEATELLGQTQAALDEFETARWIEVCERNIAIALDIQHQAEQALAQRNYDTARTLANQATHMNPELNPIAERTIRSAIELGRVNTKIVGVILFVIFLAVLLGLQLGGNQQVIPSLR